MPKLTQGKIANANKKYGGRFALKYRAFNILQNNIEDVVRKSTQMWKLLYGLTTIKQEKRIPLREGIMVMNMMTRRKVKKRIILWRYIRKLMTWLQLINNMKNRV